MENVGDIAVSEIKLFLYIVHVHVCNSYNFGNNNPRRRPMDWLLRLDKGMGNKKSTWKKWQKIALPNAGPRLNAGFV